MSGLYDEDFERERLDAQSWLHEQMQKIEDMKLSALKVYQAKIELATENLEYRQKEQQVQVND